jgi:hypothetical protein
MELGATYSNAGPTGTQEQWYCFTNDEESFNLAINLLTNSPSNNISMTLYYGSCDDLTTLTEMVNAVNCANWETIPGDTLYVVVTANTSEGGTYSFNLQVGECGPP